MFLCVKVLNSFEVKERVCSYLVVLGIFSGHGLEVLGAPLSQNDSGAHVNNDASGCHTEELDWVQGEDNSEDKAKFDDERENLEKSHPENHAEGLRAAGYCSYNLSCFTGQMEG